MFEFGLQYTTSHEEAVLVSRWQRPVPLLGCSASAQNISGVITGTVVDSRGAVISNAQITLTNQQTKAVQTLRSNEAGIFVFSTTLPGTYTVEVSVTGFRSYQVRDISVSISERRTLCEIAI